MSQTISLTTTNSGNGMLPKTYLIDNHQFLQVAVCCQHLNDLWPAWTCCAA